LSFSHSSFDIPVEIVLRLTTTHCSQSTRRSFILSFQNSKLWALNFFISILNILSRKN
jgi:hypothetical protein